MTRSGDLLPRGLGFFHPVTIVSTWFGSGLLPRMPGTWGSLAALPFAWWIRDAWGPVGLGGAVVILALVGLWAASAFIKRSDDGDPGAVVVDEVVGQWLVLIVAPPEYWIFALGFVLFRAADIVKPWPVSWADRSLSGGFGVMADDILAAVYAAAALWAILAITGTLWGTA